MKVSSNTDEARDEGPRLIAHENPRLPEVLTRSHYLALADSFLGKAGAPQPPRIKRKK